MTNNHKRFFIASDDSGHDYVVPWAKREEWYQFVDRLSDDCCEDVPDYADRIDGGIVTFTSWEIL
jgi:hypothetical protein